jgi:hypothetical protein
MKDELIVQDHFPFLKEEDLKAATKRREDYSLARDLLAKENNEAIAHRLARDKAKQDIDEKLFEEKDAEKSE